MVWDVKSGKTVLAIRIRLSFVEETIIYSPDTTVIATDGSNEENVFLKIRDANTGKLLTSFKEYASRLSRSCPGPSVDDGRKHPYLWVIETKFG